jgi:hypothetical protein
MTCAETTMHVYSNDGYRTFLVATFRFEVHARPVHYCKAKLGVAAHHSLHLPASHTEVARNVYYFSSNKAVCRVDDEGQVKRMVPQIDNHIGVTIEIRDREALS